MFMVADLFVNSSITDRQTVLELCFESLLETSQDRERFACLLSGVNQCAEALDRASFQLGFKFHHKYTGIVSCPGF